MGEYQTGQFSLGGGDQLGDAIDQEPSASDVESMMALYRTNFTTP